MAVEMKPNIKLKSKRTLKGWEQKEVASRVGITVAYYSMIESGKRVPRYEVMEKIADVYGVKPDYFFYS